MTVTESVVSGNPNELFTLGFLVQDLAANGLTLGPVMGGVYVVVGSLQVTTPAGVTLSPMAPIEYFSSPPPPSAAGPGAAPSAPSVASSAQRAVVALSALVLAVLAAAL